MKQLVIVLALALVAPLASPHDARARAVFDPTDPAFAGSTTLPLPPPGFSGGTLVTFETQGGGVTFRLECLDSPCPVGPGGIFTGGATGLRITMSPPVSAVGVVATSVDGEPGGLFVGSAGSEVIAATTSPIFFGATGIGDIGALELSRLGHFFNVSQIRFVPPGPPPGQPPVGVRATARAGDDDPADADEDGDPGTADAADDYRGASGIVRAAAQARAELNAGFVRRRVQARATACGGGGQTNQATSTARVVQRFVSSLTHGASTPADVDVVVGIDFDGELHANRLVEPVICQHRCPPDSPPGGGQIAAGVRGRVVAYPPSGLPIELFDEQAAIDYAQARDQGFFPSPGWADYWQPTGNNPFPINYHRIGFAQELEFFDLVSGVLTVPLGEPFTIELVLDTATTSSYMSALGFPGCAVANFFHTGALDVTTTTPGVVLTEVDENGNPISAPTPEDADGDGVADACDSCKHAADPGQEDADDDGIGDACDVCPAVADDFHQYDSDQDGFGDQCDNAPFHANPDQADGDGDAIGDVDDNCPAAVNQNQQDEDEDGAGDACDACPADPDPACAPARDELCGDCADQDGDGLADLLDPDCAASFAPLALKRGALALDPRAAQSGDLLLQGTFALVPDGVDPRAHGITISLAYGDGATACVELPPGSGWKTNRSGSRWIYGGGAVSLLARPEIDAFQIGVNLGDVGVAGEADAGEVRAAVRVGERAWASARTWRTTANGRKLVTP